MDINNLAIKYDTIPYFSDDDFRFLLNNNTIDDRLPLTFLVETENPTVNRISIKALINLNNNNEKEIFIKRLRELFG